jgi:cullin 3
MSMLRRRLRPLRRRAPDPDLSDLYSFLDAYFEGVRYQNLSGFYYEPAYRTVFTLVLRGDGEKVYSVGKQVMEELLATVIADVDSACKELLNAPGTREFEKQDVGQRFLKTVTEGWVYYHKCICFVRDLLMYAVSHSLYQTDVQDRQYAIKNNLPTFLECGFELFRTKLIQTPDIGPHVTSTILKHIALERQSYPIDRDTLNATLKMMTEITKGEYGPEFEALFTADSTGFYRQESHEMLDKSDTATYLRYTDKRLQEEADRVQRYLGPTSEPKFLLVIENELITTHMKTVCEVLLFLGTRSY